MFKVNSSVEIKPCKRCGKTPEVNIRVIKPFVSRKIRYYEIECPSGCCGVEMEETLMKMIGGISKLICQWNNLNGA